MPLIKFTSLPVEKGKKFLEPISIFLQQTIGQQKPEKFKGMYDTRKL